MSDFDKLHPQAIDLEEAILGACLLDKNAYLVVADLLAPETFYKEAHSIIWEAIQLSFNEGKPIDIISITHAIRKMGLLEAVGGAYAITALTNSIREVENIQHHAMSIKQLWMLRELIVAGGNLIKNAYLSGADPFDLISYISASIDEISLSIEKTKEMSVKQQLKNTIREIEASAKNDYTIGQSTGIKAIDKLGRLIRGDLIVLGARPGMGKCFGLGTKVLMFDGSIKNVENIIVGDVVMGNDSSPRNVLSLARGKEMMYWVKQLNGIDYRVNESHILSLKRSGNTATMNHGEVINISVRDFICKSEKFKSRSKGYKVGVDFAHKELPIEPYFLGVWLGDGASTSVSITNPEPEILLYLRQYALRLNLTVTSFINKSGGCITLNIVRRKNSHKAQPYSLQQGLRKLKLLGNKHIPRDYLINSRHQRLELLAGILDTDGYLNGSVFEITQKSFILIKDIQFLCNSLGLKTTVSNKKASIKSTGFTGIYYKLIISGNIEEIPVKVTRRKPNKLNPNKNCLVTGITVIKDCVDDYYGFEIDGNNLFLLEDFTVVHNSSLAIEIASNVAISTNEPVLIFSLEMTHQQLWKREISRQTSILHDYVRSGRLTIDEWKSINNVVGKIGDSKIEVYDFPRQPISYMRRKMMQAKNKHGTIGLVVIDYLQLAETDSIKKNGTREQEISQISRGIKVLAKEFDTPVIAIASLSRASEKRTGGSVPIMSDLREGGSIESDADKVWLLYRPEYYGIMEDEEGQSTKGIAMIYQPKNRSGDVGKIKLRFNGATVAFDDMPDDTVYTDEINSPPF